MFVALEIIPREADGFFNKLRGWLTRPGLWLETGECLGSRYALLRVQASGRTEKIDWQAVERVCGIYKSKLLLPEGLDPPPESGISQPELRRFNGRVFLRTSCEAIARTHMPMYKRVLGFIDREAQYSHMLRDLLAYFTSVEVVTDNEECYRREADLIMEQMGAPVMVGSSVERLGGCTLILSPGSFYTSLSIPFHCPVIAGGAFVTGGPCNLATTLRIEPSDIIKNACPAGIDPHDFAGALYEFCAADISTFLAEKLLYNYRVAALSEVVADIARSAGLEHPYFLCN